MKAARALLVMLAAGSSGAAAAAASFFLFVRLTPDLALLQVLAAIFFVLVSGAVASLASPFPARRRFGFAAAATALGLAVAIDVVRSTILRPMDFPYTPAKEPANIAYWDLPTGSRIAYLHTPSVGQARPSPVVFIHGGPGQAELMAGDVREALAEAGFDVYTYHQYGAGLSNRATSSREEEYTVARHVADLEAIREALGAERLILVGQSWGGTLSASYAAAHPSRVDRLVLTSPGPSWLPAFEIDQIRAFHKLSEEDRIELARLIRPLIRRLAFHRTLAKLNPEAADRFITERQFDGFVEAQVGILKKAYVCDPAAAAGVTYPGQGYWVNRHVFADLAKVPDPRPKLREVEAPALILKPECDYVDGEVALDFRDRLPNAKLIEIPGAGHEIRLERPDLYIEAVRAFLLQGTGVPTGPRLPDPGI